MVEDFHDQLLRIQMTPKIPDYSFTLSPLIKPGSGITRIENYLKNNIERENHPGPRCEEPLGKGFKTIESFL